MKRCILHIALFVAAAVLVTACGSGKKDGVWTDGTFSLNYPPETYEVTGEDKDGELSCFTISCKEEPSNNIEFKVYRYEPDFVKTIRIDQIAGELKADVYEIRERLCGMLLHPNPFTGGNYNGYFFRLIDSARTTHSKMSGK